MQAAIGDVRSSFSVPHKLYNAAGCGNVKFKVSTVQNIHIVVMTPCSLVRVDKRIGGP